ncbi:hypothetical protein FNF27_02053 [Cafeteria roenbergensis]|uniref:Ion transport domain-containing protein n=1 Tax=Cafeteria roenbergensis TaxID=33653 RepID=A0A5A8EI89_CAFRO|nr:hypothetical protein FNF27_02053 [Cafeteria roenbergensis]
MAIELGIAPGGLEPGEVEVKPSGWHILPSRCRRKAKPWTQADLSDMHRALAMLMRLPTAAEKAAFAAAYRKQQAQTELQPVALCCLTRSNPLRVLCEHMMRSWWFDQLVVVAILVNCVVLALFDPLDTRDETWQNQIGNILEWPFTVIFTLELVIKIVAMGLLGKRSYLADGWNWIDGSVVVVGYFGLFPGVGNVSALRTFRVLRPLRTLTRFEGMRVIVQAMLSSVPALFNVALLCAFIFLVFGIIGVQLWAGVLHGRCMYETPSGELLEHPDSLFCALSCEQFPTTCTYTFGQGCPAYEALVANTTTGLLEREVMPGSCHSTGNPGFGGVGFDNIGLACLTIFTAITLEGWVDVMYALTRAWGIEPVVTLYFILVIMFGAFFLLNLALAVVWDEYETAASERIESQRALIRHLTLELQAALPGAADEAAVGGSPDCQSKSAQPGATTSLPDMSNLRADGSTSDDCAPEAAGAGPCRPDAPHASPPAEARASQPGSVASSAPLEVAGPASEAASPAAPAGGTPQGLQDGSAVGKPSTASPEAAGGLQLLGGPHASLGGESGMASPTAAIQVASGGQPKAAAALKRAKPAGRRTSSRVTFVTDKPDGIAGGNPSPRQDTDTSIRMDSSTTDGSISTMGSGTSTASSIRRLPTAWQFTESDRAKMGCCQYVATSRALELSISFLIGLNTIALAIEHHGMSSTLSNVLEILNYCFTAIFAAEMLIKLAGLGLPMYCRSAFNVFDAVVVCVSVVEIILSLTSAELASGLSALRTFRLMRVFKLAKTWKDLQRLLVTIMRSVLDVASASVVLLIIMFIFVLLGMQLFGGRFGASTFGEDQPRAHFDNFGWAFVTVFQVLTGENWNEVLFASKHAVGDIAVAYFVALTIVGNYLMLNLFLAILLGNFEKAAVDDAKAAAKKRRRALRKAQRGESEGQAEGASPRQLESAGVEDDSFIQASLSQDALEGGAQPTESPRAYFSSPPCFA